MRFSRVDTARSFRTVSLVVLVVTGLGDTPGHAFSRGRHEDAAVVARSELIVVARMEAGSIRMERHRDELSGASAYVHHATLIVEEVLKGSLDEKRISIIIHYGLFPIVGGDARPAGTMRNIHDRPEEYPKDNIEIGDMSSHSFVPLPVKDARANNLWFLRKRSGYFGREPGNGDYGIVDPEDLQPIALEDYFLAYLSADPEAAVRRAMEANPAVVTRGQRFLDRQEVHRIFKRDDPRERVERLLPYFLKGLGSGYYFEVRTEIVGCGRIAGPALWPIYREPGTSFLRQDVITMWGEIGYRDCVLELIALLKEHDRFWSAQSLDSDWWNRDVDGTRTGRRRDVWCEDLNAVRALGRIGDPRARSAVEATLRRWGPTAFPPRDIAEACEQALKSLEMPREDRHSNLLRSVLILVDAIRFARSAHPCAEGHG